MDSDAARIDVLVRFAEEMIELQCRFAQKQRLPVEDFVTGYAFGLIDGALQRSIIPAREQSDLGLAAGAVLFDRLFGENGADIFRTVLDNQQKFLVKQGIRIGGEEAFDWWSGAGHDRTPPTFLYEFLREK
jgi:hypothetical protein